MDFGDKITGRPILGMPGSKIQAVHPTLDYLTSGPCGDGYITEGRIVAHDFDVEVLLADGRVVQIPKQYRWVEKNRTTEGPAS